MLTSQDISSPGPVLEDIINQGHNDEPFPTPMTPQGGRRIQLALENMMIQDCKTKYETASKTYRGGLDGEHWADNCGDKDIQDHFAATIESSANLTLVTNHRNNVVAA